MKKGFTLIEMLGILVILSVIILVSVPNIVQTNKKAKANELDDAKNTIYMAAETYLEINEGAKASLKKNNYYYITLNELVNDSLLSSSMKNPGNDFEKTIVEGAWWVEARMNNGTINYSLVNNNPYETETLESEYAYNILLEKGEVVKDKTGVSKRYVYENSNPNNYVKYNNELWRIVALEADKTIKLVRNDFLDTNRIFNSTPSVTSSSSLINYLNRTDSVNVESAFFGSMAPRAQNMIKEHNFNVGIYNFNSLSLNSETNSQLKIKVGLLNPSDYIQASANSECTLANHYSHASDDPCLISNYLYKSARWWTINPATNGIATITSGNNSDLNNTCTSATDTQKEKDGLNSFPSSCYAKVRPVVYLAMEITVISGSGNSTDPYVFGTL